MANSQKLADLLKEETFEYLRPPIDLYGTLQWSAVDEIQEVGYKYVHPLEQPAHVVALPRASASPGMIRWVSAKETIIYYYFQEVLF